MASRLLQEFKEFAMKGSVVDLAVGIIIGTAFGAIVKSLVDDIIMPIVGVLLGGLDYSTRFYVVRGDPGNATTVEAAREAGASVVAYGKLVNNIITFVIVAWSVFMLVKAINRMRRKRQKEPASAAAMTRACPECTTEISKLAKRCPSCTAPVTPSPQAPS